MLIDLHTHTSGISLCCEAPAPEIIREAKETGIDGIVLTNHYQRKNIFDGDVAAYAKRYTDEFVYASKCGEEAGVRVIYGMEVTMAKHGDVHILVYGLDPSFTLSFPEMYDMELPEFHSLVRRHGGMLVQAHPFRRGVSVLQDLAYLDGVEANSHPRHEGTHAEALAEIAQSRGLILTSGGDYHANTVRPYCGTYLPDDIRDTKDLCRYLLTTPSIELLLYEPPMEKSRRFVYRRAGE